MNIAQTLNLADSYGMHGSGWWFIAPVMMLFMFGMMWMMMRGMGGSSSAPSESPPTTPSESPRTTVSPAEILERRFAEGTISAEEYRARRAVLVNGGAEGNRANKEEPPLEVKT